MTNYRSYPFPYHILKYIEKHTLIGVRAGRNRQKFVEVWMVVVNNRVFARSWGQAPLGWYTEFLTDPMGAIRCGDDIIQVAGFIPPDADKIQQAVSNAYLSKYDYGENSFYANGITDAAREKTTLEFLPIKIDAP
ncbi:DUF2255 family protein [Chitinophaga skermanii]|nr:DUF2255 family protein [Chitinophaga skermanii]